MTVRDEGIPVMGRLDGKVAIVTGAGGGIGREHARLLAREGAKVLVNDIGVRAGADAASVVADIVGSGGTAVANTSSATWDGAADIVDAAIDAFGRLDILINNATAGGGPDDLWAFSEKSWDLAMDVNLKGYFAMIRSAAPHLCGQRSGAIVNTSSGAGYGLAAYVGYASAKEGVVGLTRTVARELGRFGVRCNAIRPFAVGAQSGQDYANFTAKWARLQELTNMSNPGRIRFSEADPNMFSAAKIAPLVVWLCTDAARNVNGSTFQVGGDSIARLSEPRQERVIHHSGGWTLDALDGAAPSGLVDDLTNDYVLDGHPELQVFEP